MYKELVKLKIDLGLRKPFRRETSRTLKRLNEMDYIYGSMELDGAELSKKEVEGIMAGDIPREASLKDCVFIKNYMNTLELMRDCLTLKCSLDKTLLLKFYSSLMGKDSGFRKSEPFVREWKYVPPYHEDIESGIEKLFREAYRIGANEMRRAAAIHCGILRLYPFEEYSGAMARLAMNYYLEEKGFLPVALGYNREEYRKTMTECLKDNDDAIFFWGLERAEYNKMVQVLQIVEHDEEVYGNREEK